jgi:hypothetical protein
MSDDQIEDGTLFTRKVERDPAFVRYYADSSATHTIGSELDIAFLNIGPTIREITWRQGSTQPVSVKGGGPVAELCRVRMDSEASHNLAMNILLQLARGDEMSLESLEGNFGIVRKALVDAQEKAASEEANGD